MPTRKTEEGVSTEERVNHYSITKTVWGGPEGLDQISKTLPVFSIEITDEDRRVAQEYSQKAWTNEKPPSNYNNGIRPDAASFGKLGEIAFGRIFTLPVDLEYRKFGDKSDFVVDGKLIDCKTTDKHSWLVICFDKHLIPLKSDYYMCGTLHGNTYTICGYCTKEELTSTNRQRGFAKQGEEATHWNYVIDWETLHPITELGFLIGSIVQPV